jgi:glycosyltransferase involved in cell wall biosynthesis
MVIISDRLSAIVKKGEITPRYYNPGDLFEEVHIVMTNDDRVNLKDARNSVGRAKLFTYNTPLKRGLFLRTLGYRSWFLNRWAEAGVELAKKVKPDMIRCYGNTFNAFMAVRIKQQLGVPLVISLHGNPDVDLRGPVARTLAEKIQSCAHRRVEAPGLKLADHFIAVYGPILPYLRRNGVAHYSLVYNAVGYGSVAKRDYHAHSPIRFACVGRQQSLFKNPTRIVEAIAQLENAELIMIGTGDLHDRLIELARTLKCQKRCRFIPALANERVLAMMRKADIYVFNQISAGVSKTIIEAALTGLPIILNRRDVKDELDNDWLIQVEDTKAGYLNAMRRLASNQEERERLGRKARAYARTHWAPEEMESKVVEVYRQVIQKSRQG